MEYKSLISDMELIQGDSSAIWFIGHPDNRPLDDGFWDAEVIIAEDFGQTPIIRRTLPVNSGVGEGDKYTPGIKFVFQIFPEESIQLQANKKFAVTIEIKNESIFYNGEIARFKVKILQNS